MTEEERNGEKFISRGAGGSLPIQCPPHSLRAFIHSPGKSAGVTGQPLSRRFQAGEDGTG